MVTGGAGFIGSAFIRTLLKDPTYDGKCVNLDHLTYAGNLENLKDVQDDPRYVFEHENICNEEPEHICEQYEIDTIVHFAAESHVDRSILGPEAFFQTNIMGTFHLLEVVRRNPHIHFHHISTDEVYGSLGQTGLFTETSPYQPNSPYSASKASSDHLVRAYHHTYNLSTCITNCSNNYGPYQFPEKLIPLVLTKCMQKQSIPIYGKGDNIRDWLYVEDHVNAILLILQYGRTGETYNIGGDSEKSNIDLVHELIQVYARLRSEDPSAYQKLITFVKDRPGHDKRYAIDCTKLKQELGWKPKYTFSKGIEKTIQWYLNNLEWMQNIHNGSYRNWLELNYTQR
jgi:dTDP-glucose 4,6-dehydratase